MEHPRITDLERDYIVNNVEYDASKRVIGRCLFYGYTW